VGSGYLPSVPKRPVSFVGTGRTPVPGVPGVSQAIGQERPSFGEDYRQFVTGKMWSKTGIRKTYGEKSVRATNTLPVFSVTFAASKSVTVGAYSLLRIGNSPTVPAILTRYLPSSPIPYRALRLPAGHTNHLQGLSVTRSFPANCT